MFGNDNGDRSGLSIKPGINSGFKMTELLTKVQGDGWTAYDTQFDGGIKMRDRLFVPTIRTAPNQYDAQNLERFNKAGEAKNKPALSMAEWLKMKNEEGVRDFIRIVNMYAYSFYPDKSPEIQERTAKRAAYPTVEDFLANVDTYVAETLQHVVPANYRDADWDVLVGKKEGGKYLEFPKRYQTTGRYVKLSSDETRELVPSDYFKKSFIPTNITETAQPAAAPAASVNWGAK